MDPKALCLPTPALHRAVRLYKSRLFGMGCSYGVCTKWRPTMPHSIHLLHKDPKQFNQRLGGSWVVRTGVYESRNLGYNYSYPTYKHGFYDGNSPRLLDPTSKNKPRRIYKPKSPNTTTVTPKHHGVYYNITHLQNTLKSCTYFEDI